MLKVKLQYSNLNKDGQRVHKHLSANNVTIIKSKITDCDCHTNITVLVKNNETLNRLISDLNNTCFEVVRVLKVKTARKL